MYLDEIIKILERIEETYPLSDQDSLDLCNIISYIEEVQEEGRSCRPGLDSFYPYL